MITFMVLFLLALLFVEFGSVRLPKPGEIDLVYNGALFLDELPRLLPEEMAKQGKVESSVEIRKRVVSAREVQQERYKSKGIFSNAQLTLKLTKEFIPLGNEEKNFMINAFRKLGLTGRGFDRILRVARTIADLDFSENVKLPHIAEAMHYTIDLSVI